MTSRRRARSGLLVAAAALLPAAACLSAPGAAAAGETRAAMASSVTHRTPAANGGGPCVGQRRGRPSYDHVMWIWMENESFGSVIGSAQAPYATKLARSCGLATDYHAIGHPSLPNYLAATGGTTAGVTDDGEPAEHPLRGPSIFSQLDARSMSWRAYAESMPVPCDTVTSGLYAARHNPAVYYLSIRAACEHDDVAMGLIGSGPLHAALYGDRLASFVFVTPNICDDAHSCPIAVGDAFMNRFLSMVFASPTYRLGRLAVFVTWDEGTTPSNQVATIVAARSVPPGTRSGLAFNHYSLLRTAEQLLGLPPLGLAGRARSMVAAFSL